MHSLVLNIFFHLINWISKYFYYKSTACEDSYIIPWLEPSLYTFRVSWNRIIVITIKWCLSFDKLVTKIICNKWLFNYLKKGMNWFTPGVEPFPDAVVSFYRVDEKNMPKQLLYVGALIKPNWILVPEGLFEPSERFNDIRIYTGRKMKIDKISFKQPSNFIDFKIVGKKIIAPDFELIILVVSTSA